MNFAAGIIERSLQVSYSSSRDVVISQYFFKKFRCTIFIPPTLTYRVTPTNVPPTVMLIPTSPAPYPTAYAQSAETG